MSEHAKLSASSAERWLACPGSIRLSEGLPDTSSVFAQWGTTCHELAEKALSARYLGEAVSYEGTSYEAEMYDVVAKYRDYIAGLIAQYQEEPIVHVEVKLDMSDWIPEGFGTADCVLVFPEAGIVVVIDLKAGVGVKVVAENNPQLKLYGASAAKIFDDWVDIQSVRVCVAQPRLDHYDDWTISMADLALWLENTVKPIAAEAFAGSDTLVTGDHCRFCKAKDRCPALAEEAIAAFSDHDVIPGLLTPEQISALLPKLPRIIDWAKGLQSFALDHVANGGGTLPGFKLVEGRAGNRKWRSEDEVADALHGEGYTDEDIFERKLIGITAAERLLGKKHQVFELTVRGDNKLELAPLTDARSEYSPFTEITES